MNILCDRPYPLGPIMLKVQEVEVACLSVKDAARYLGIAPRSVIELKLRGHIDYLPKFPWSKEYVIPLDSLRSYVERNRKRHTPILSVVKRPK